MSETVNGVSPARFVSLNEALYRIKNRADRNLSADEGFVVNLEDIRAFLGEIDSYNVGKKDEKVIKGVRVWKSRQKIGGNCHDDVLFSPVNRDASDIHMVSPTEPKSPDGNELLLMCSLRPCPSLCSGSPLLIQNYSPTAPDTNNYNSCSAYPKP